ncbi:MAG: alpha/beta hydrolase [Candidatus Eremiobacteraeota bacterium]|nr:alpha/beta hydrolase [Candidatus Eremiobacteraeota bacterium]
MDTTSDGLRIAYVRRGSGEPLVFLHGVGSTKEIWRTQMAALPVSFDCVALDYRGYGESEVPPPACLRLRAHGARCISRAAFARDVFAVMDACGMASAHLCGCSLGGVVALEAYAQRSRRIRSLILVDAFARHPHGLETIGDRLRTLFALGMESFAESRAAGVLKPQAALGNIAAVREQMRSIPLAVYAAATQATWTGDYGALLPQINQPVQVMWGEHDTIIAPRALSEELVAKIPTASPLVVVPDAGHVPNVDNPEFFNATLAAFVRSASYRS